MISVIIRTFNEGRWIRLCLESVFDQTQKDFEVVVVDSGSEDNTLEIVAAYPCQVVKIDQYTPGRSLNAGIRASSGDTLVCLNAHCIPIGPYWLEKLVDQLTLPNVGGVYGRQLPMSFSSSKVKHELLNVFGLDKKVQVKDSLFHNANSAFTRKLWKKHPFDEAAENIEDRLWAQQVIDDGYTLIYEPEAGVYHYHGIGHEGNKVRDANVARIISDLALHNADSANDFNNLEVVCLIPVRGNLTQCGNQPLLDYTIRAAKSAGSIKRVFVIADDDETVSFAKRYGVDAPFLRPAWLSDDLVDLQEVIHYSLSELERQGYTPDLCVVLEETYPFRHPRLIDELVAEFLNSNQECLIPVKKIYNACWTKTAETIVETLPMMPRHMRDKELLVSLFGLGAVMSPRYIKETRFGEEACVYEVDYQEAGIEMRDAVSISFNQTSLEIFWRTSH